MAFNKCSEWTREFSDVFGIEVENIKQRDFEKLTDIISIWEVMRLAAKSDINVENYFKFLTSCKVVSGRVGREFDECLERGINKANILFNDLIQIAAILRSYYIPNHSKNGSNIGKNEEIYIGKNCYFNGPTLFKPNKPIKSNVTISTNNTGTDLKEGPIDQSNLRDRLKINNTKLEYVKRAIPFVMVKNYIILHMLNEGSVGKVYLAVDYKRKFYAVKMISKDKSDYNSFNKIKDELIIASNLKNENIVETHFIMETKYSLLLFMEYCSGGDLITFIRKNRNQQEQVVKTAFKMILKGIKYLHENNIYHRDIKPENIFLVPKSSQFYVNTKIMESKVMENNISENKEVYSNNTMRKEKCVVKEIAKYRDKNDLNNYVLKVGDFGASVRNKKQVKLFETVGTMSYAAPEVLEGVSGYLGEKADIWSLGVVLYAMLFGQLPYRAEEETVEGILKKILNSKLTFPNMKTGKEVRQLISSMLEINPYKRITLNEILRHEWISGRSEGNQEKRSNLESKCMVKDVENGLNVIVDEMI